MNAYRAETRNQGHINEEHVIIGPDGSKFCGGFKSLKAAQHTTSSLTHGPAFSERGATFSSPDDEPRHYGNSH